VPSLSKGLMLLFSFALTLGLLWKVWLRIARRKFWRFIAIT
jgi:hypothetical protein